MTVKPLGFGESLPSSWDRPLTLKQKGDKVQFKIGKEPVYTAKHFTQVEDKWDVTECKRLMSDDECELCNKYFHLMGTIKRMKAADKTLTDESPDIKKMNSEIRIGGYNPAIQFFFPILDRGDGKMKVLQITNGVKNKFNGLSVAGTDIMSTEWVLANTGGVGVNKYLLTPVDSAKVKKLTPEEEDEFKKAKDYDLSQIGGRDKSEDDDFDKFAAQHSG